MERDFLNWYKNKFKELDSPPPADVWENISNSLDVDEVWQGINSELDKKEKRMLVTKVVVAFTLLVSAGIAVFFLNNTLHNKKITAQATISKTTIGGSLKDEEKSIRNTKNKKQLSFKTPIYRANKNNRPFAATEKKSVLTVKNQSRQNKVIPPNADFKTDHTITDNTKIKKQIMMAIPPILPLINTVDSVIRYILMDVNLNDSAYIKNRTTTNNASKAHSFMVGFAFANANTWLLNSDTYNGLKAGTLNQAKVSYGKSYNVLVGYHLSNKYCLQTEWVINNTHQQQYIDYQNGKEVNRDLKVNFTQVNVLMKNKNEAFYFGNKLHTSFNYLAGINYSYVKSFTQQTDETISSVKGDYQNNQYSIILGLEYQVFIHSSWIITSGLRSNIGLQNIYKGNAIIPSQFNRTYDSSIGLNIGLCYQFNK
jgi:hypothetical protein